MTILNTENRELMLDELNTINGGEECVSVATTIRTAVGIMTFGTISCGMGISTPYITWTPAPK